MGTMTLASGNFDKMIGKYQYPIRAHVQKNIESYETKSQLKNIFYVYDSTEFADAFTSEYSKSAFAPVGENGRYPESEVGDGYSVVNEYYEWKDKISFSKATIEDGKMGTIGKPKMNRLAENYYRGREKFGAAILSNGIATTMSFGGKTFNIACADSKALFATDHPSKTGGAAQSNLYNAELNYVNIGKAETLMQSFKDDAGELIEVNPDTIIIPNTDSAKRKIFEILNAEGNPTTADNAGNYHLGRWNVIVWKYLTTPSGASGDWFIMMDSSYNQNMFGLVWGDRVKLEDKMDIDPNTDAIEYKVRARFGARPNNWRSCIMFATGLGSSL